MAEDLLPAYVKMGLLAQDSHTVDELLVEHCRLLYGPAEVRAIYQAQAGVAR